MAKLILISWIVVFTLLALFSISNAGNTVNVMKYGAKPDGKSDSTQAFVKAWVAVCNSAQAVTMYVPQGRFVIKAVEFRGPCKSKINVQIDGTIVAPADYRALGNTGNWILFIKVNRVTVNGGTLDGRGAGFWNCRKSGNNCPEGARSITFNWANDIKISGLTSINSQAAHLVINGCNNVMVQNVRLNAPDQSPNTDGIHVQTSTGVTITGTTIKTGDDCVSIGPGTRNLWMERIQCGPGHGVSIGSLGKVANEAGVQNITLINSAFTGSDNGLRIKSWARPTNSFVSNVVYQNIQMRNVENPIIIDQNYCPNNQGCPHQTSGVKITGVTYKNVQGTSASKVAVTFDCSPTRPCTGIKLQDVKLSYLNTDARSTCKNSGGSTSGISMPDSCLKK
ncbi:polygalacturonase-like [Heracleum sosnowskyi]|uniref:Polygalacturonase-like n=1 Tax=Heracleum sosnowskyi TaxID=360622 RepID=A0AAD8MVA0_9APIA|nr:polygalacturonase-like [Heracleum sosnowskyi]